MGKGQRSLRRTAGIGAFVAIVVLALSLPSIAFAANTTIFRGMTPKAGSSTSVTKPKISVVCYDKYGVKRASRTSMTLDGVKVAKTLTWYRGWHHKKFKLTYKVPSALSLGSHKVVVRVVDLRHKRSRKTWRFTVVDRTPPVTTSDAARGYTGSATIHLSATDNVGGSGVAHTYYKLDDGARTEGAAITVSVVGVHTLEFWSVDARGNAESPHVVSFRVRTTHTVSGACFNAACHSTDVTVIHSAWANPPGCAACHGAGKTPSLDCATCHSNIGTVHAFAHANASGTKSSACTACHGTDLPTVHTAKGCVCHTASFLVGEMTTLLAAGKAECVDCHKGDHAAHGFDMTVSGHNTTTYGRVGARTDFSSLGVTDTVGAAPTAQFPLTVNNTFKAGYSWTTVVTCEDCHAGLTAYEVAGPHGSNVIANAGIDPAYPGSFESASLWGGTYAKELADGTTYTVGPFAEGIAQWAPAGTTEEQKQELVNYQVVTPDMSNPTTTALVVGPATVTAGNVICVKCHDLYDATKTTGFKGWANYAHEHHSADTGSFKMNFGKFNVYNISGNSALTGTLVNTVVAESNATALSQAAALNPTAVALYYKVYSAADGKSGLLGDFYYRGGDAAAALAEATATVPAYATALNATVQTVIAVSLGREDAGACRNCHIAIPHAWKRPRLIVYSNLPDPAGTTFRADKGLPAAGDVAPYNIGPAVYEGEALNGTAVGSGQMNGLASGIVTFKEAQKDVSGAWVTASTPYANLVIETEYMPALVEINKNPLNVAAGFTGDEYINWSSSQCNACGHHSSTSFANPTATQPALTWNKREYNWTSTKPAHGAFK